MIAPEPVKRFWRAAVLGVFFCLLLFVTVSVPGMFVSPDENANAIFSNTWATRGVLFLEEPLNLSLHGLLHPRSILAPGSLLVPGSFLGFPVLAGTLGALLGSWAAVLLTPVCAVLAIVAFRSLLLRLSANVFLADAGAFLFMFHPAFWYYASRPMMHNVVFLSLVLFAVWFAVVGRQALSGRPGVSSAISMMVSGLCFGLALAVRASEALWLVPLVVILFLLYRKAFSVREVIFWIGGSGIALFPFLIWNHLLYGSIESTGYTAGSSSSALPKPFWSFLFPFDIHFLRAGKRVLDYGILLYPWTAFLPIAGWIGSAWAMWWNRKGFCRGEACLAPAVGILLSFLIPLYLAVMYGSWIITDNPNPQAVTIGNSYVRYWLPIFLIGSAWGAVAVSWLFDRFGKRNWFVPTLVLSVVLYVGASGMVVFGGEDGLLAMRSNLFAFADKKAFVLDQTPSDAIIVVDRADKFLFPDRRVLVGLRSDVTYNTLGDVTRLAPLYYFGITLPEQDMRHLNEVILAPRGLGVAYVGTSGDESLYRIFTK